MAAVTHESIPPLTKTTALGFPLILLGNTPLARWMPIRTQQKTIPRAWPDARQIYAIAVPGVPANRPPGSTRPILARSSRTRPPRGRHAQEKIPPGGHAVPAHSEA